MNLLRRVAPAVVLLFASSTISLTLHLAFETHEYGLEGSGTAARADHDDGHDQDSSTHEPHAAADHSSDALTVRLGSPSDVTFAVSLPDLEAAPDSATNSRAVRSIEIAAPTSPPALASFGSRAPPVTV
jgi:hypothetical protein